MDFRGIRVRPERFLSTVARGERCGRPSDLAMDERAMGLRRQVANDYVAFLLGKIARRRQVLLDGTI